VIKEKTLNTQDTLDPELK